MDNSYNELNDIILDSSDKSSTRKKMLIGIGTLLTVLIATVIVISQSTERKHVAQPMLPKPTQPQTDSDDEEMDDIDAELQAITQKAMSELQTDDTDFEDSDEVIVIDEDTPSDVKTYSSKPKVVVNTDPTPVQPRHTPPTKSISPSGNIFIQVGSFSRYQPNKTFLYKIKRAGYEHSYDRVVVNGKIINKVLVGPFESRNMAKSALRDIRKKIEAGAFIYSK